jgi:hypothetical protein
VDTSKFRVSTTEVMGEQLKKLPSLAIGLAVVGAVLTGIGFVTNQAAAFQGFLHGYLLWFGVTVGSLGFLMLHHVVGGGWGFIIRRPLEAATSLPIWGLMIAGFVVIALGMPHLYGADLGGHHAIGWMHAEAAHNPVIKEKMPWLNQGGFLIRAAIYFAVWISFAHFLRTLGDTQDQREDRHISNRLNHIGSFGMLMHMLLTTFAMVDWVLSLQPTWNSSLIGLMFVATQGLTAMALMITLVGFLAGGHPIMRDVKSTFVRDLGNLTLALVMLWGYTALSQYLITYSGNTVEEVSFYIRRAGGGWGVLSLALIPLLFVIPFLFLLTGTKLKDNFLTLRGIALYLFLTRIVDLFWWIAPTFRETFSINLADIGAPLLLGGLWLLLWANGVKDRPVLPLHDPRLVSHAHGHEAHAHG